MPRHKSGQPYDEELYSRLPDSLQMYCRLAVLMAEKNPQLSQRQLAEQTRLNITTINRLFTNKFSRVDTNTVEVLCEYFEKNVGDLFEVRKSKDIPKRQERRNRKREIAELEVQKV